MRARTKQWRVRAYTLTEMLVVLVIIGLLAAIVGPRLFSRLDDAKARTARLQMTSLQTAVDLFRLDVGRLPNAEEGLQALVQASADETSWLGPYLARDAVPVDPWGNAYVYKADQTSFRIVSYGADGREGGTGAATDLEVTAGASAAAASEPPAPTAPASDAP